MSEKTPKSVEIDENLKNKIYQLYLITDPDNQSVNDNSELLIAKMDTSVSTSDDAFVEFEKLYQVGSKYRTIGRGNVKEVKLDGDEYSDLIRYNGKLLTCCDATGIVFHVDPNLASKKSAIHEDDLNKSATVEISTETSADESDFITAKPQHIITHDNGKPMKLEWMTVYPSGVAGKNHLLMGGHGTTEEHREVFVLNALTNTIDSYNWSPFYDTIALHLNVQEGGYVVNEAIVYSEEHQCLVVAPRVISRSESFDEDVSYKNGCGKVLLLSCTNNNSFKVMRTIVLQDYVNKETNDKESYHWGFSAIQSFGKNHFIGVQTREIPEHLIQKGEAAMNSRLVMFDIYGNMYGSPVETGGPNVLFEFENRKIEGLWIDM